MSVLAAVEHGVAATVGVLVGELAVVAPVVHSAEAQRGALERVEQRDVEGHLGQITE